MSFMHTTRQTVQHTATRVKKYGMQPIRLFDYNAIEISYTYDFVRRVY